MKRRNKQNYTQDKVVLSRQEIFRMEEEAIAFVGRPQLNMTNFISFNNMTKFIIENGFVNLTFTVPLLLAAYDRMIDPPLSRDTVIGIVRNINSGTECVRIEKIGRMSNGYILYKLVEA